MIVNVVPFESIVLALFDLVYIVAYSSFLSSSDDVIDSL